MPVSKRIIEVIAWLALIANVALAIADLFGGRWDHDSGMFFLHAAYIADGLRPYLDYSSIYPPLMELLTAMPVAIFSDRLTLVFAVSAFWIVANAIASALLAFVLSGDRATAALLGATFPLFAMMSWVKLLTLEYGVVLFATLALAAAARRFFFLAGVFVTCSALVKQPGLVVIAPVLALAWPARREFVRFVAGGAAVVLPLLAWLSFDVAAILRNVVRDLGTYAAVTRVAGWRYEFLRSPDTVWLCVASAMLAAALLVVGHRRAAVAAGAVGAIIEFLPRIIRNYPHYNLNTWPFLLLIVALAAERWGRRVVAPLLLFVLLISISTANHRVRTPSELLTTFAPAARVVEAITPAGAPVRDYGAEPIIEFLAHRKQERIDLGTRALKGWEGEEHYPHPPAIGTTVVVVDRGQPWVPRVIAEVRSYGSQEVSRIGRLPRVTIYR